MARKAKTDAEKAIEMIKKNPELLKLLIGEQTVPEQPKQPTHSVDITKLDTLNIRSNPKYGTSQVFFDDPNVGTEEGKWDKKHKKKFKYVAERRPAAKKIEVTCGCGKKDEISEKLFEHTDTYQCAKCLSRRT